MHKRQEPVGYITKRLTYILRGKEPITKDTTDILKKKK